MASISEIKLNGNLYDIKDAYARNSSSWRYETEWNGDTSDFTSMRFMGADFYRIQDAIELEQESILMANLTGMLQLLQVKDSSFIEVIAIVSPMLDMASGSSLNPGNVFVSSFSMAGAIKDMLLEEMFAEIDNIEIQSAIEQELADLENANIHFGISIMLEQMGEAPFAFCNVPQDTQIGPYLCDFFGIPEELNVMPAGLWARHTTITNTTTDENGETVEQEITLYPTIFLSSSLTGTKLFNTYFNNLFSMQSTSFGLRNRNMTLEESIKTGDGKLIFKALINTLKSKNENI